MEVSKASVVRASQVMTMSSPRLRIQRRWERKWSLVLSDCLRSSKGTKEHRALNMEGSLTPLFYKVSDVSVIHQVYGQHLQLFPYMCAHIISSSYFLSVILIYFFGSKFGTEQDLGVISDKNWKGVDYCWAYTLLSLVIGLVWKIDSWKGGYLEACKNKKVVLTCEIETELTRSH